MAHAHCSVPHLQGMLDHYATTGAWRRTPELADMALLTSTVGIRDVFVPVRTPPGQRGQREMVIPATRTIANAPAPPPQPRPADAIPTALVAFGCVNGSQLGQCLFSTGTRNGYLAWHVPERKGWRSRGRAETLPALGLDEPLWVHTIGDSTMRFFYAAWLSLYNGTQGREPGYPLHWLPDDDKCSFTKVKWISDPTHICFRRWRGRCAQRNCTLDATGTLVAPSPPGFQYASTPAAAESSAWRLSFEWFSHRTKDSSSGFLTSGSESSENVPSLAIAEWMRSTRPRAPPRRGPHIVLFGAGLHEAVRGKTGNLPEPTYVRPASCGSRHACTHCRESRALRCACTVGLRVGRTHVRAVRPACYYLHATDMHSWLQLSRLVRMCECVMLPADLAQPEH